MHDLSSDAFSRGARLFDSGRFFDAHEAWEERWRVATDDGERRFLQGLIQVAAGFHKLLVMGSAEGAGRLLAKGLAKLDACPARVGDFDLATFRDRVRACGGALVVGGLDASAVPKMGTC